MGQGLLIIGTSRSHSDTHTHTHIESLGPLSTSGQFATETSTRQHTTLTTDRHPEARWDSNSQFQQTSGPGIGSILNYAPNLEGIWGSNNLNPLILNLCTGYR